MMTYEEWLKSTEFGLRRRYKVKDIFIDNEVFHIDFTNNFNYLTSVESKIVMADRRIYWVVQRHWACVYASDYECVGDDMVFYAEY